MTNDERQLVRRRADTRKKKVAWWWPYRLEILALVALILGITILLGHGRIRATLRGVLSESLQTLSGGLSRLDGAVGPLLSRITVSDILSALLVVGALVVILWRVRERALRDPALTALECPQCGGSLHRIHRTSTDRVISKVVPVRRYICSNSECRWKGLRVGSGHTRHSHRATATSSR